MRMRPVAGLSHTHLTTNAAGTGATAGQCPYYTVQSGDTLSSIASSLGLSLLDLESSNTNLTSLQPNTYVQLPGW